MKLQEADPGAVAPSGGSRPIPTASGPISRYGPRKEARQRWRSKLGSRPYCHHIDLSAREPPQLALHILARAGVIRSIARAGPDIRATSYRPVPSGPKGEVLRSEGTHSRHPLTAARCLASASRTGLGRDWPVPGGDRMLARPASKRNLHPDVARQRASRQAVARGGCPKLTGRLAVAQLRDALKLLPALSVSGAELGLGNRAVLTSSLVALLTYKRATRCRACPAVKYGRCKV